jgi:hypothetical protein
MAEGTRLTTSFAMLFSNTIAQSHAALCTSAAVTAVLPAALHKVLLSLHKTGKQLVATAVPQHSVLPQTSPLGWQLCWQACAHTQTNKRIADIQHSRRHSHQMCTGSDNTCTAAQLCSHAKYTTMGQHELKTGGMPAAVPTVQMLRQCSNRGLASINRET